MNATKLKALKKRLDASFKEFDQALRRKDDWAQVNQLHSLEELSAVAYKLEITAVKEISSLEREMYY